MKKVVEWKVKDGRTARVVIDLRTSKVVDLDGYKHEVKTCDLVVEAYLGAEHMGYNPRRIEHPVLAGTCGKLGILEENMERIESAISECKATQEYKAWEAKEKAAIKAEEEALRLEMAVLRAMDE